MISSRPDPRPHAPPARDRVLRYAQNTRVLAALAIFGVILGLAGPFGTIAFIPLPIRLVYWLALTFLLAPLGTLLSLALSDLLIARRLHPLAAAPLGGLLAGPLLSVVIFGFNHLTVGRPFPPPNALTLGVSIAVITAALNLMILLLSRSQPWMPAANIGSHKSDLATPPQATLAQPRLLSRLRPSVQAPLVALRATDHYTEVTTEQGSQTILLRLVDAIREAAPTDGLQVHRSHWVARRHIAALRREKGRIILTLSNGRDIPVSRTYEQAVAQAGGTPDI
jgi:hypothetical protein